jgi:flagellar protein FliO/FliZ
VTGTSSTFTILRMLAVLALAALAVYGVVFFIKKASRPPAERDPYLRVLARVSLGGSSSASVLALGSQAWIVGASEGGVSLIAEVAEGETLDAMLLAESERAGEAGRLKLPGFHALLRKLRQNTPPPPGPNIESIRQRRDRLKGL